MPSMEPVDPRNGQETVDKPSGKYQLGERQVEAYQSRHDEELGSRIQGLEK